MNQFVNQIVIKYGKIRSKKDQDGNIIISFSSFEYLLNCLDNQKEEIDLIETI
ncbi:MAG: hypothetical protein M0R46_10360 [Candidatus Muirbacterium halophilum]|nr:hypothetical protein [Candidatus Muirbacterium halophilum]